MGESAEDTLLDCLSKYMNCLFDLREVGIDLQAMAQGTRLSKSIQNFNEIVRQYQNEIIRPCIREKDCPKTILFDVKSLM